MAEKNGAAQLKKDLLNGTIQTLYVIHGQESYLKEYYVQELVKQTVDDTFREFNLQELEGKGLTPEQLSDAIESYPAMAERKLVVVRDFDLYKPPAAFSGVLPELLGDLPNYICVVFFYDTMEFKPDKRTKNHAFIEKTACIAEFSHLEDRALTDWIRRRVRALHKDIDDETCAYLIFLCGNSMINLITEIEKAAAFSTIDKITKYHIDAVCSRVLSAVIFDLTDAIADRKFERSIALFADLMDQKGEVVQIFSTILHHLQRLYAAKLVEQARAGERTLMDVVGSRSPYYARKLAASARKLTVSWLRRAMLCAAETDAALKSSGADQQKLVELTLLRMAADFGEEA